jgi:hypothetical protein
MRIEWLAFVLFIIPFLLVRSLRPYTPWAIIGFIIGVPLLLTRSPLGRWMNNRDARREPRRLQDPIYAMLRREVQVVGKQLEALPYERLLDFDDSLMYQAKNVDGIEIYFNSNQISVEKNGDLQICTDANAVAPGWQWRDALPSYNFWKRKDGTVYY